MRLIDCSVDERDFSIKHAVLLGTYELKNHPDIPYRVVVNEAVELIRSFGGIDGHKYVNGVLDKLASRMRPDELVANERR